MDLKKIRIKSNGSSVWILCGATLSSQNKIMNSTFTPGSDFKPGDIAETPYTRYGSALDFSAYSGDGPCGKYGKVIFTPNGNMEFEKRPGVPLRFKAAYHYPDNWLILKNLLKKLKKV